MQPPESLQPASQTACEAGLQIGRAVRIRLAGYSAASHAA